METRDVAAAAYEPHSGYADPVATTKGFLTASERAGARLREGTRVTSLRVSEGKIHGVVTERETIDSPIVVSAAGCYSEPLLRTAGVEISEPSSARVLSLPGRAWRRPPWIHRHHPWDVRPPAR